MATVLILDGLQRKSLAMVRELGAAGHRILTAETTYFSLCRFSRYAARSYTYPHPSHKTQAFMAWLKGTVARTRVDVVFPMDDDTTEVLIRHGADLGAGPRYLVPPQASFEAMRDKALSAEWFRRTGVPHPDTVAITDLSEVKRAAERVGVPCVIKARRSAGSRGIKFVRNVDDVERLYAEVHQEYPWPIVQAFVPPGPKYHVCMLYGPDHRPLLEYVQHEVRQYPLSGGPSTMQVSVSRPDLLSLLRPLFEVLPWTGPLEADIMEEGHTGKPYVLEVNPRYWSSLQLAQRAGADFAGTHLAAALNQPLPTGLHVREGVWGRALVPFDVLAYLSDSGRAAWNPPFLGSGGMKIHDDLLAWVDPGPTLGFLLSVGRFLFDRQMWRAVLRRESF